MQKGDPQAAPCLLRGDQNPRSKSSAKLERLLLPTRSMTRRMFAELSPSSEVLLSPTSAPAPQSWVVAAALVRWHLICFSMDEATRAPVAIYDDSVGTVLVRSAAEFEQVDRFTPIDLFDTP